MEARYHDGDGGKAKCTGFAQALRGHALARSTVTTNLTMN